MHSRFIRILLSVSLGCTLALASPQTATKTKADTKATEEKASQPASSNKVDLNSASQKDLEGLPGVGAATAKKIIAGRPYASVTDLQKSGVPAKTIEKITPLVVASGSASSTNSSAGTAKAASSQKSTDSAKSSSQPSNSGVAPSSASQANTHSAQTSSGSQTSPGSMSRNTSADSGAAQQPPQPGMVWVNLNTKVYHKPGNRWYGKTKHGQFMTEDDAIKAGFHASKE